MSYLSFIRARSLSFNPFKDPKSDILIQIYMYINVGGFCASTSSTYLMKLVSRISLSATMNIKSKIYFSMTTLR